jgi:hypothetical protein
MIQDSSQDAEYCMLQHCDDLCPNHSNSYLQDTVAIDATLCLCLSTMQQQPFEK